MRVQLQGDRGGRIETQGFWICMNKDTLTPSRLTDACVERFGSTTDNKRLKWRPWVTEPVQAGDNAPFPLRRTDIDVFEHVNNTIYWHGVHEILAAFPELEDNPYRAVLEYRRPIKYGETLTLRSERSGDAMRMDFTVGEDLRAAALVRKI